MRNLFLKGYLVFLLEEIIAMKKIILSVLLFNCFIAFAQEKALQITQPSIGKTYVLKAGTKVAYTTIQKDSLRKGEINAIGDSFLVINNDTVLFYQISQLQFDRMNLIKKIGSRVGGCVSLFSAVLISMPIIKDVKARNKAGGVFDELILTIENRELHLTAYLIIRDIVLFLAVAIPTGMGIKLITDSNKKRLLFNKHKMIDGSSFKYQVIDL
ncbi:MAG: hypothetical protein RJA07_103 [Bacteroidota bacterium]|jgi:hypothetical protein